MLLNLLSLTAFILFHKNIWGQVADVFLRVKCLLYKCEDLSSHPLNIGKSQMW